MCTSLRTGIDLYWLPLGAGGHSVRLNGRIFEAVAAQLGRRERFDLYHSALEVRVPEGRFVIEMAPNRPGHGTQRGVVAEAAVGTRAAGRFRLFRYEIRRWRDGIIPDIAEAVDSPLRLSDDPDSAWRLLGLVPQVPTPVWGRDELGAGEMWNSNSVISWLIARSGLDVESIQPPLGGRAPGWRAGIVMTRRQQAKETSWLQRVAISGHRSSAEATKSAGNHLRAHTSPRGHRRRADLLAPEMPRPENRGPHRNHRRRDDEDSPTGCRHSRQSA